MSTRFPVSAVLALALLAACAPAQETRATSRPSGRQEPSHLREVIRAECMKEKGFTYHPFWVFRLPGWEDEEARARDAGDYLAMRRFREKYGYGIFSIYIYPWEFPNPSMEHLVNPNNKLRTALSRTQIKAYDAADDACYRQAVKTSAGKDVGSLSDHLGQANAAVDRLAARELDGDPRLARLGTAMAACLARKGYSIGSAKPSSLARLGPDIVHAEEDRLGKKVPGALARPVTPPRDATRAPGLSPAEARPYLAAEIRTALDDLECGKHFYAVYEPRYTAIYHRVYLDFGLEEWT
jgi:hypothetical protein